MAFFNNSAGDWERLDWQILRDGGIELYWRSEYLAEESRWFLDHGYEVYQFNCANWLSRDEMFSDFARVLRFPDWWGRNLDALDDCMDDLPLTENRGAVMVLANFDSFAGGPGSVSMQSRRTEAEIVLDILARASRFHLLSSRRLVVLVQTNDPHLSVGRLGGMAPQWNRREWLDANRQTDSR